MESIFLFILIGICMGVCSGMLGLGGGIFAVPLLLFILEQTGYTQGPIVQTAVFTSLSVVCLTTFIATVSRWRDHKEPMVYFILRLTPGLLLGGIIGALSLLQLSGYIIKLTIAALMALIAYSMLLEEEKSLHFFRHLAHIPLVIGGVIVGTFASLLGISGGLLTIPLMRGRGQDIKATVAISTGCGVIASITGVATGMVSAVYSGHEPTYYIHTLAFICLALVGTTSSHICARNLHRVNRALLKRFFAIFLFCLTLYLVVDSILELISLYA